MQKIYSFCHYKKKIFQSVIYIYEFLYVIFYNLIKINFQSQTPAIYVFLLALYNVDWYKMLIKIWS